MGLRGLRKSPRKVWRAERALIADVYSPGVKLLKRRHFGNWESLFDDMSTKVLFGCPRKKRRQNREDTFIKGEPMWGLSGLIPTGKSSGNDQDDSNTQVKGTPLSGDKSAKKNTATRTEGKMTAKKKGRLDLKETPPHRPPRVHLSSGKKKRTHPQQKKLFIGTPSLA